MQGNLAAGGRSSAGMLTMMVTANWSKITILIIDESAVLVVASSYLSF